MFYQSFQFTSHLLPREYIFSTEVGLKRFKVTIFTKVLIKIRASQPLIDVVEVELDAVLQFPYTTKYIVAIIH